MFTKKDPPETEKRESEPWRSISLIPFDLRTAEESYRLLVDILDRMLHAPAYYIYSATGGQSILALEHMDLRYDRTEARRTALSNPELIELLQNPEPQIPTDPAQSILQQTEVWAGTFLNLPLTDEDGSRVGIVLAGPRFAESMDKKTARQLQDASPALGSAVRKIQTMERLREEMKTAASRALVTQRVLGSALEVNRFVSLLLDLALTASKTEAGFVAIADERRLTVRASKNLSEDFLSQLNLSSSGGLFEWSVDANDVLILQDLDFVSKFGVRSILSVPLVEDKRLAGVFCLVNFVSSKTFEDQSLTILKNFCEQIRLVLNNSRLFGEFTDRYLNTLKALSESYDVRSPFGSGHSKRVAKIAVELGTSLGLKGDDLKNLELAAEVHDVGMCGVVEIKTGFQADFNHPTIGASLVEVLPISPDIASAIRTHHEWYDGWGFPDGLKGEAIPVMGRILAVAEYYEEIQSGRMQERLRDPGAFREDIATRRGTQFDPKVVDALMGIVAKR